MIGYREILKLVWPLALGMINNAVMQFADRAYLAHHSLTALEAALPAGMLMWIFAGFFQSVVGYSSVFVGQFHGAGEAAKCRATYRAALLLAAVAGVLSFPCVTLGKWILSMTASNGALLADEASYFTITMSGGLAVYVQTAAASYFTGRGETRLVFWVNLLGNAFNIVLDPVLIFGGCGLPALGIAGAAYATVASMVVQAVVLVGAVERSFARDRNVASPLLSDPKGEATFRSREGNFNLLLRLLRFGIPSGLYTILNMATFTVFVFVTEGVGALELAVSNACFSVNYLLFAPMEGFSLGASTLVAQAIGRGEPEAAVVAARRSVILGVAFAAILSGVTLLFAHPILGLFAANAGAEAGAFHALGTTLLALMATWLLFDAADIIVSGALKGAGDTKFVMVWMVANSLVLWLPLVFVVRRVHNTMPALWATMIVYIVILCLGSFVRWNRGAWRGIRLCPEVMG